MSAAVKTKALAAFVQQCLDPLPDAVLIDTHHNQLMRQARRLPWRKADAATSLTTAEMDYWHAKSIHAMYVLEDEDRSSAYSDKRMLSVDRNRQAVADQIRVPAPDLMAVQWKREAAKDRYLPIGEGEVAKLIAGDEAFLAAHPITKQPRKKTWAERPALNPGNNCLSPLPHGGGLFAGADSPARLRFSAIFQN